MSLLLDYLVNMVDFKSKEKIEERGGERRASSNRKLGLRTDQSRQIEVEISRRDMVVMMLLLRLVMLRWDERRLMLMLVSLLLGAR